MLEDGDKHTNGYGEEFELLHTARYSNTEFTINVFHEVSDDELETVQDHFTLQVIDDGQVSETVHGLYAAELVNKIFEVMKSWS